MTANNFSEISIKRFLGMYLLYLVGCMAVITAIMFAFDVEITFGFMTLLIPMFAALDTGIQYATRHKSMMENAFAWRVAMRLNWIHMLIQIVLGFLLVLLFWAQVQTQNIQMNSVIIAMLILVGLVFFLSWAFIRWGLHIGAKAALKQAERDAQ